MKRFFSLGVAAFFLLLPQNVFAEGLLGPTEALPWWGWAVLLFAFTIVLGIFAVIAGVGGGVLFVPIVGALFPFHLDFVRGAGLMVALCGALSAAPTLLKRGLADIRMALPLCLIVSLFSVLGAKAGLALPEGIVKLALGGAIMAIVLIMFLAKRSAFPMVSQQDFLSKKLGVGGAFTDQFSGKMIFWKTHRMPVGLVIFSGIGFLAGMFGLGAGWANVPALNLLLGAPLTAAVATSGLMLSMNAAAAWVYLNSGAVIPLIAVPSVAGMMIGTRIGARILPKIKPGVVRWLVISILVIAGLRSVFEGIGGLAG